MAKPELRRVLAILAKSSSAYGYDVAIDSLEEALGSEPSTRTAFKRFPPALPSMGFLDIQNRAPISGFTTVSSSAIGRRRMRQHRTNRTELRSEISSLLSKVAFSQTAVRLCEAEAVAPQERFLLADTQERTREPGRSPSYPFPERSRPSPCTRLLMAFDFASLKLSPSLSREELCSAAFIAEKKNLVLYGPVGTGKTHLATALGVLACSRGIRTRFFTAAELVVRLSEAFAAGTLEKLAQGHSQGGLSDHRRVGLRSRGQAGAQLLFRIISDSYERRSVILTTNLEFSKWGSIFTDDQMAAAMIDRLAHHGHILLFEGESFRMKHALMRQKGQTKIPVT